MRSGPIHAVANPWVAFTSKVENPFPIHIGGNEKDDINVPMALSVFRDGHRLDTALRSQLDVKQ